MILATSEDVQMNLFTLTFSKGNTDTTFTFLSDSAVANVEAYIRSQYNVGRLEDWSIVAIPMCYPGTDGKLYKLTAERVLGSDTVLISGASSVTYPETEIYPDKPKSFFNRLFR